MAIHSLACLQSVEESFLAKTDDIVDAAHAEFVTSRDDGEVLLPK